MSLKIFIVYAGKLTLSKYIKTGVDSVNNVTSLIKTASTTILADVLGSGDYNGNPEPDTKYLDSIY